MSRRRRLVPYGLLAPGDDLAGPLLRRAHVLHGRAGAALGHVHRGFTFSWDLSNFPRLRSTAAASSSSARFFYAGAATVLALLIAYPLAYAIAVKASPRWRLLLLFAVIAPFFTTYLIRTIAWKTILADSSPIVDVLQPGDRPRRRAPPGDLGRRDRRAHLQLPAVHDPADLRQPRADRPEPDRGGQGPLRVLAARRSAR